MQIKTAAHYFGIRNTPERADTKPLVSERIYKLDKEARDTSFESGASACVEDFSNSLDRNRREIVDIRYPARVGLVLSYPAEARAGLEVVYKDRRKFEAVDRNAEGFSIEKYPIDPEGQANFHAFVKLDDHIFYFPLLMRFGLNYDSMTAQRNSLTFQAVADPDETLVQTAKEACKDCNVEVYTSSRSGHGWSRQTQMITSIVGMPAPEVEVHAVWEGEEFDRRAIDLYGKLADLFLENHRETTLGFAESLFRRSNNVERGIVLNQERPGLPFSDMNCSIRCEVPFKDGDAEVVGSLFYPRFFGR